jgi:hypothetical protein
LVRNVGIAVVDADDVSAAAAAAAAAARLARLLEREASGDVSALRFLCCWLSVISTCAAVFEVVIADAESDALATSPSAVVVVVADVLLVAVVLVVVVVVVVAVERLALRLALKSSSNLATIASYSSLSGFNRISDPAWYGLPHDRHALVSGTFFSAVSDRTQPH